LRKPRGKRLLICESLHLTNFDKPPLYYAAEIRPCFPAPAPANPRTALQKSPVAKGQANPAQQNMFDFFPNRYRMPRLFARLQAGKEVF